MSVLDTLTEGIRARSLANEGEALLEKWERTGLLEGLNENASGNMARLLENQLPNSSKKPAQWLLVTLKALPQLHSQSFAVFSATFWHRTLFRSNP